MYTTIVVYSKVPNKPPPAYFFLKKTSFKHGRSKHTTNREIYSKYYASLYMHLQKKKKKTYPIFVSGKLKQFLFGRFFALKLPSRA